MMAGRLGVGALRSVLQNLIIERREQQRRCLATDPTAASRARLIMPASDAHNHECARRPDCDRFFRLSASVDQRWNPITEEFGALPATPPVCGRSAQSHCPAASFSRPVVIGTCSDPIGNDIIAPKGSTSPRLRELGSKTERLRRRTAVDRSPWLARRRRPCYCKASSAPDRLMASIWGFPAAKSPIYWGKLGKSPIHLQ
jgi:hypothetical protein